MEVKDIIKKREILERDIQKYLNERLYKFFNETFLMPSHISISLSEIRVIGSKMPVRITVGNVEVEIRL